MLVYVLLIDSDPLLSSIQKLSNKYFNLPSKAKNLYVTLKDYHNNHGILQTMKTILYFIQFI